MVIIIYTQIFITFADFIVLLITIVAEYFIFTTTGELDIGGVQFQQDTAIAYVLGLRAIANIYNSLTDEMIPQKYESIYYSVIHKRSNYLAWFIVWKIIVSSWFYLNLKSNHITLLNIIYTSLIGPG